MDTSFLVELLLLIALAAAGVALFERLRLPSIVGFLSIGALVGPSGLGLVDDAERVSALAELGVVFLLFEIGLELPMDRVRRLWRRALAAGGLQVAVTVAAATLSATALGLSVAPALVMGGLVAMSSTALVIGILSSRGEIDAPQGQLAIGILLFQDLCIVPFLLAVPLLAAGSGDQIGDVFLEVGSAVGALVVFTIVARLLLPRLLDWAASFHSRELFTLLAVLVVLGSAVVAEEVGLTLAVGAFIGGLALSASPYSHQLFAEVLPLRGVLLGLFFTAVGMLLDVEQAAEQWVGVLAYVGGVVLLKAVVVAAIVALALRQGVRLGVLTGLALAQTGEFSFVLAAAASNAGVLDPVLRQVFIAGSVATLFATPFLVQASPRIASFLAGGDATPPDDEEVVTDELEGHVIIVGFGMAGRTLARVLRARSAPYVAVDANPRGVREARAQGEPAVYGDATRRDMLQSLRLTRARLLVLAISDTIATREAVRAARSLTPEVPIIARTRYVLDVDRLHEVGADVVIAEENESTLEMVTEILRHFGSPEGSISRFTSGLREEGYELLRAPTAVILDPWLTELIEEVATEWVEAPDMFHGETSLAELEVRARTGVNVVAVERAGVTTSNPAPSFSLRAGDRLLCMGAPSELEELRALLSREEAD